MILKYWFFQVFVQNYKKIVNVHGFMVSFEN